MNLDIFKEKVVLITGATGLIGSHIAKTLLALDRITVIVVGRNKSKLEKTFIEYKNAGKIIFVEHDVSIPLPSSLGLVDFIFHAASPISGEIIKSRPLDVINSNLNGTINCLEYLKNQGKGKMIVFSSATVYSVNDPTHIAVESATSIAECINGSNAPYSESKRMIEVIANAYHKQFQVDTLIVRFSYVYGYSANPAKTAFYEFIKKALNGSDIDMNNSGLPRRDNIYVDDAVLGLLHLCSNGLSGETYNISSNGDLGNYAAIDEIAEIIARCANIINGTHVKVIYKTDGKERNEGLRLDNTKAKSTGWFITSSMEEGIKQTLLNYKNNEIFK